MIDDINKLNIESHAAKVAKIKQAISNVKIQLNIFTFIPLFGIIEVWDK